MNLSITRFLIPVSLCLGAASAGAVRLGEVSFEPVQLAVGSGADYAAAADVDADGRPDLLTTRRDGGELVCFPNTGNGEFGRAVRTPAGSEPVGLAPGDFDGDGVTDVAVANHETDHVTLLLGDGRCGFTEAPGSPLRVRVNPHVHAVAAADLDGDGHLDLVVDARGSEGLLILPGLGKGRFDTDGPVVPMGGDPYRGMTIAELNGDGRPDLVTPNPRMIGIALGRDGGRFSFEMARPLAADTPFGLAAGDLDGDGRPDLVSGAGQSSAAVEVFLGEGGGGFRAHPDSPFAFEASATAVTVGDFDADGFDDAAVSAYTAGQVMVLMGDSRELEPIPLRGFENPWGLATADFNNDRHDDLAVVDQGTGDVTVFMSDAGQ